MKSESDLAALPANEQTAWRIAELLTAHNSAVRAMLKDALRTR